MAKAVPTITSEDAWRAFFELQGVWLDHRVKRGEKDAGPCDHKEQRDVDAAADAYMAARRREA